MKKLQLPLIYLSILFFISCSKDNRLSDPCSKYYKPLPSYSTSGNYVFGCKINDEDWVAYTNPFSGFFGGPVRLKTRYNRNVNYLSILASRIIEEENCDSTNQSFFLKSFADPFVPVKLSRYTQVINYDSDCVYKIDSTISNKVEITHFDTLERIISGIFHATLISEDCNDTLFITNGRFDDTF